MTKNYAEIWRNKSQEMASEDDASLTGEINLDGFEFIGRRLPLQKWIRAKRVPQALTAQMIRIFRKEQDDINTDEIPTEDLIAADRFQEEAICYVVVSPKIVTHSKPLKEGEVRWSEVFYDAPHLIDRLMGWIFQNCPGVPVKTESGETDLKSVESFPVEGEGESSVSDSNYVSVLPRDESFTEARDSGQLSSI